MPCTYPRCKADATMRCALCSDPCCPKHAVAHFTPKALPDEQEMAIIMALSTKGIEGLI